MKKLLVSLLGLISMVLTAQDKPNVILFLVDDLGYYDLSVTGSEFYETPNIDALAGEGMMFTNAYASHPRCVPSRYAIQTGKYPARGQVPGGKKSLTVEDRTIGEAFKDAGYTTFFAGKWHLGRNEKEWPQNQGYDYNVAGCAAGAPISYFYPYNVKKDVEDKSDHKRIVGLDEGVEGEYLTDRLTDETIAFIKAHKDEPFFAMLSHYGVHTPFQAKQEVIRKYRKKANDQGYEGPEVIQKDGETKVNQDNAVYAAMIESVDESLGNLVRALREAGIADNTVIVFTSDHGGLSNRGIGNNRKLATSNLPLRAGKGHLLEGGIKVPFIVYWPGEVEQGSVSGQVTINIDIYPTLLEIVGISDNNKEIDGVSLVPSLKGGESLERTVFWHSPLARPSSTGDWNSTSVRQGDYKLVDWYDRGKAELYDLGKDASEEHDLYGQMPEKANELMELIRDWRKSVRAITVDTAENRWYKKASAGNDSDE